MKNLGQMLSIMGISQASLIRPAQEPPKTTHGLLRPRSWSGRPHHAVRGTSPLPFPDAPRSSSPRTRACGPWHVQSRRRRRLLKAELHSCADLLRPRTPATCAGTTRAQHVRSSDCSRASTCMINLAPLVDHAEVRDLSRGKPSPRSLTCPAAALDSCQGVCCSTCPWPSDTRQDMAHGHARK